MEEQHDMNEQVEIINTHEIDHIYTHLRAPVTLVCSRGGPDFSPKRDASILHTLIFDIIPYETRKQLLRMITEDLVNSLNNEN